jgi:hypothetical protein
MHTKNKNEKEVYKLIDIVKNELDIDPLSKVRTQPYPDIRRVIVKILMDRGWGCTDLGKLLNKNHATILHYKKNMDFLLKHDNNLKKMYDKIYHYYKKQNLELYSMTNEELKKEVFSLRKQNKMLISKIDNFKTNNGNNKYHTESKGI